MIYSCFNPQVGMYEYFEDNSTHPTNADLPVPSLPSKAGKVGVPAQDAGRSLPPGARRTGTGWRARGIIVQCKNLTAPKLSGLGEPSGTMSTRQKIKYGSTAAGAILGYVIAAKYTKKNPVMVSAVTALIVYSVPHFVVPCWGTPEGESCM